MNHLPQIKKKISAFLTSEEGKISKNSVIKLSLLASASGLLVLNSLAVNAGHSWVVCISDQIPGISSVCQGHSNSLYHYHSNHSSY